MVVGVVYQQPTGRLPVQVSYLGPEVCSNKMLFYIYHVNQVNSCNVNLVLIFYYGHPPAILFYRCSLDLLFSPPNLRGRMIDRHQTLPQCHMFDGDPD